MGAYERKTFRWFWGAWCWAIAGAVMVFGGMAFDRALWVAFAIVETWGAVRRTDDDTFSEFGRWVGSWGAEWGLVQRAIVGLVAYHAGRTASYGLLGTSGVQRWGPDWLTLATTGSDPLVGVAVAAVVVAFLRRHL